MSIKRIIIDAIDDIDELSAILNTNDNTGDVNADDYIRDCSVAACLAFCNSKVLESDRGDFDVKNFSAQLKRIDDNIVEDFEDKDTVAIIRTAINLFISDVSSGLIMAIEDQSLTPVFRCIREDLSLEFGILGNKNEENEDPSGGATS